MLSLKMPLNIIMSLIKPSGPGPPLVKSNLSQLKEVIEDTILETIPKQQNLKLSTLVFPVPNKKKIYKDKSHSFNLNTQPTNLSSTSVQELTLEEKVSKGYWKECLKEPSKKLWLPKKIDSQDLDFHYLNGFSNNMEQRSFVIQNPKVMKNKNSPMILWLSSRSSPQDTMVEENTTYKTKKVRFYPTRNQKLLFEQCFGATRYLWNKAIKYINSSTNKNYSFIDLRNACMDNDSNLSIQEQWLKQIPYDTRQLVFKQFTSNLKTNFSLLRSGKITHFKMNFKSKKNPYQMFFVDKRALKPLTLRIFKRRSKEPFKLRKCQLKKWVDSISSNVIIKREKNRYYMCIPIPCKKTKIKKPHNAVYIDPGVRTFLTFYSEEGIAGKLGDQTIKYLYSIGKKEDKLKSIITSIHNKKKRYNLRKRCFLLRTKIKNIVNDLHWKSASWLTLHFSHIFLPSFEVKQMVRRSGRNINSTTSRNMLSLSHYKFSERIRWLASQRGCEVHEVNESWTTQTCGGCGNIQRMKGKKVYECTKCGFVLDRDYNGARNICLKSMLPGLDTTL